LATGVSSWSTTAATNSSADSAVNWAEGQAPSSVNDSARAMMASVAKWRDDLSGAITTAGTSTAYTATTNQSFASLSALDNRIITIVPHTTSGAAPTLAVDSLTAKAINISTTVAVPTGYLVAGTPYVLYYEAGVGEYIVLGAPGAITGTTGTFSSTLAVTGVSTFSAALRAANGAAATPSYSFTNSTNMGMYRHDANNLALGVAGAPVLFAYSGGITVDGVVESTTGNITGTLTVDTLTVSTSFTNAAAQADQETATSTSKLVTPGVQQFHPSAAKCWIRCDHAGNTTASFNITSITDTGTGVVTVTIATDFSGGYPVLVSAGTPNVGAWVANTDIAAGSFIIKGFNTNSGAGQDSTAGYYAVAFGDQ
jgi:hypothetical protein